MNIIALVAALIFAIAISVVVNTHSMREACATRNLRDRLRLCWQRLFN